MLALYSGRVCSRGNSIPDFQTLGFRRLVAVSRSSIIFSFHLVLFAVTIVQETCRFCASDNVGTLQSVHEIPPNSRYASILVVLPFERVATTSCTNIEYTSAFPTAGDSTSTALTVNAEWGAQGL